MLTHSPSRPGLTRFVAGAAGLLLLGALAACATDLPGVSPEPDGTSPAVETPEPSIEPAEEPVEPAPDPAVALRADLSAAVSSGETDALDAAFTDPVRVVIASSEADSQVSALDAVLALDYVQPGVGTWEWDLPSTTLDGYRASEYYGDFFPADVIVGRSSEGPVVAFSTSDGKVHTILMAIDEQLLFF